MSTFTQTSERFRKYVGPLGRGNAKLGYASQMEYKVSCNVCVDATNTSKRWRTGFSPTKDEPRDLGYVLDAWIEHVADVHPDEPLPPATEIPRFHLDLVRERRALVA